MRSCNHSRQTVCGPRRGLARVAEIESRAIPTLPGRNRKRPARTQAVWVALVTNRTPVHDAADAVLTLYELTATAIDCASRCPVCRCWSSYRLLRMNTASSPCHHIMPGEVLPVTSRSPLKLVLT